MKQSSIHYIIIAALSILLVRCAAEKPLSGGPKDITPPKQVWKDSYPNSSTSLNFKGDELVLKLNEDIKVQGFETEFSSTPALKKTPKYSYSKKKVTIKLEEELSPNTTYTFNFGSSIRDLNEGNPIINHKIVFSTGNVIDSLEISGNVVVHETGKPASSIKILLFDNIDTLSVAKHKPYYSTKTDANGSFKLANLREGTFNLYALDDKNSNGLYTQGVDLIGFTDRPIVVNKNIVNQSLVLTKEALPTFKVISKKQGVWKTDVTLNKGVTQENITSKNNQNISYTLSGNQNVFEIFRPNVDTDSVLLQLFATDSSQLSIDTSITVYFSPIGNRKKNEAVKTGFSIIKKNPEIFNNDSLFLQLTMNQPISAVNLDSIYLHKNGSKNSFKSLNISYIYNKYKNSILFFLNQHIQDTIDVSIKNEAFISVTSEPLATQRIKMIKATEESFGSMKGKIQVPAPNYLVILKNSKNTIYKQFSNIKSFDLKNVIPDTYTIEIWIDQNNDGKFSKGDLKNRVIPERILFYKEPIVIKANWEVEDINIVF